jgi:oxygen-independent coproporphyrinogen-3 oxidase
MAEETEGTKRVDDFDADVAGAFDDGAVGVYLHLPFCERICPYCDFAVVAMPQLGSVTEAGYTTGLLAELDARRSDFQGRRLASVYFGGGTPSLFTAASIREILEAIHGAFPSQGSSRSKEIETTLELNPSTVERERLPDFRAAGINRLSIGVQSFDDRLLKRLGRAHRAPVARETLEAARAAGFDNLSIDLIFAGPSQSASDLDRDLEEALAWSPEHISTYELTYEPETPFGRALAAGKMGQCDEDLAADMTLQIEARLEAAGYERYEISNYARGNEFRSRHNARYWQRQAVLGLGMGAHSAEARSAGQPHGARRANPRSLSEWEARVQSDPARVGEVESLSEAGSRGEAIFLALRQREGLSAVAFEAEFGGTPRDFFASEIDAMTRCGWLVEGKEAPGDLRLTDAGRLLADRVAAEFVATD